MAFGHFMMAFEPLFLFALLTLILANGPLSPISRHRLAAFTRKAIHRRDRAYSIFYVGINLGAFLAPLVCGTLGEMGMALWLRRGGRRHGDRASVYLVGFASCHPTRFRRPKPPCSTTIR